MASNGSWYGGPKPFDGRPPPPPPQWQQQQKASWNQGYWAPNPAYVQGNRPNYNSWMPGQGWPAQQQNGNPYKRVVKPPSAEYLSSALSDNPLGLTNMVPRDEVYAHQTEDDATPHTPWFWNPSQLDVEDGEEGIITAVYKDEQGHSIGRESRGPAPTRQSSIDRARDSPVDQRARTTSQQSRHASEPVPQQSHPQPHRYASEPPPDRRPSDQSHYYRQGDRPQSSRSSSSTKISSASAAAAARANSVPPPQRQENFTSEQPLRPTFSLNIIRTPNHYASSSTRSSSASNAGSTPTRSAQLSSQGSLDSAMAARMNLLTTNEHPQSSPTRRQSLGNTSPHHSAGNTDGSVSGVTVFVDEPSSMLSPLLMGATSRLPSTSNRIGRQHSAPTVGPGPTHHLSSIPETSPIPPAQQPAASRSVPSVDDRRPSNHANSTGRYEQAHVTFDRLVSPRSAGIYAQASPPKTSSPHASPATDRYDRPSPTHDRHLTPPDRTLPPVQISPFPSPSRPSPRRRRRQGFWNRRGDHLVSGKIVYAPSDLAYPAELSDYPNEKEGYMDEFGIFMGYLDSREELEDSLPRHGMPPRRPYDSFIQYHED